MNKSRYTFKQLSPQVQDVVILIKLLYYDTVQEKLNWAPRLDLTREDILKYIARDERGSLFGMYNEDGTLYE